MGTRKQVALVVGASRGIGRQVAIDLAKNGYAGKLDHHILLRTPVDMVLLNGWVVVVAAKSISDASAVKPFPPHPNSQQSTISTVEREIHEAGGDAHAIAVDVRDFDSVQKMVDETAKVCPFMQQIPTLR